MAIQKENAQVAAHANKIANICGGYIQRSQDVGPHFIAIGAIKPLVAYLNEHFITRVAPPMGES